MCFRCNRQVALAYATNCLSSVSSPLVVRKVACDAGRPIIYRPPCVFSEAEKAVVVYHWVYHWIYAPHEDSECGVRLPLMWNEYRHGGIKPVASKAPHFVAAHPLPIGSEVATMLSSVVVASAAGACSASCRIVIVYYIKSRSCLSGWIVAEVCCPCTSSL